MLIAGAISFSNENEPKRIVKKICDFSLRNTELQAIAIFSNPNICIHTIQRTSHNPRLDQLKTKDRDIFLIGDLNYARRDAADDNLDLSHSRPPGRWIKIEAHYDFPKLTLTTDILGSQWIYYARIPGGYAFANDFAALVKSLPYTPTIDAGSIGVELALSYSPNDATIFEEVKVLPPASCVAIDAEGIQISSHEPIVFTDKAASLSEKDKFEKLDEIYSDIVSKYVSRFEQNLVLSLSAGYDSRYALAALHKQDINPNYCTFGNPDSSEVVNAQVVANHMGASTNVFDYEAGRWSEWVSAIESLGTTGMIQWNGWAERWLRFERQFGSASISGYLGDALTGKHLGDNPNKHQDWLATWLQWSTDGDRLTSPLINAQLRKNLTGFVSESLVQSTQGQQFLFPHQAAMYLDLYGRQRRRVANQANLTLRFLTPVLFFYDKPLIEFWCSLDFNDLHKQNLYIKYANSRFNDIFSIYDQGRKRSLIERIGNKYSKLIRRRENEKATMPRPKVIEHENLIAPNRLDILSLIERVEPALNSVLDLDILRGYFVNPSSSPLSSPWAIQGVNLCILANLIVD